MGNVESSAGGLDEGWSRKKKEIKLKEDERLHLGLGVASKLQFTAARGN